MAARKDSHKVGTPEKPRGQQMGFAGNEDQNRREMEDTPALSGGAKKANKMLADKSSRHVGGDATAPSANSPSTGAMSAAPTGESGGEKGFKKRLAGKRGAK